MLFARTIHKRKQCFGIKLGHYRNACAKQGKANSVSRMALQEKFYGITTPHRPRTEIVKRLLSISFQY